MRIRITQTKSKFFLLILGISLRRDFNTFQKKQAQIREKRCNRKQLLKYFFMWTFWMNGTNFIVEVLINFYDHITKYFITISSWVDQINCECSNGGPSTTWADAGCLETPGFFCRDIPAVLGAMATWVDQTNQLPRRKLFV